MSIDK